MKQNARVGRSYRPTHLTKTPVKRISIFAIVLLAAISIAPHYPAEKMSEKLELTKDELVMAAIKANAGDIKLSGWYEDTLYFTYMGKTSSAHYDNGVKFSEGWNCRDAGPVTDAVEYDTIPQVFVDERPVHDLPSLDDVNDMTGKDDEVKVVGDVDRSHQMRFVRRFAQIAKEEQRLFGIPASIKLAQGILESASGDSYLAKNALNFFGIKCRASNIANGCSMKYYDRMEKSYAKYTSYDYASDSWRDHSLLISEGSNGRYKHLPKQCGTDYRKWAYGLKKAGYATDRNYPRKLINIIEALELYKYDK